MTLTDGLETFLAEVPRAAIVRDTAARTGLAPEDLHRKLATYLNETRVARELVEPVLRPEHRILEVGAGLGFFSLFLKQAGYEIWALEPDRGGFGFFGDLRASVREQYAGIPLPLLSDPVERITPDQVGRFDLIFSLNVMEHIPAYGVAFHRLAQVLKPDGVMVHSCPNYRIPYEPHFGIPVIKGWPSLSARLFRSRIQANRELWDSLNFIGAGDVLRVARDCGLRVRFRPGLLARTLERLDRDAVFAERHSGFPGLVATMLLRSGLIPALRRIPPPWATPMAFEMRHEHHEKI